MLKFFIVMAALVSTVTTGFLASAADIQKYHVLLVFEKNETVLSPATLSDFGAITAITKSQFLNQLPWAQNVNFKSWPLVNGFSGRLSRDQIASVWSVDGFKNLYFLDTPEQLQHSLQETSGSVLNGNMTWGLKRMNVDQLSETRPEIDGTGIRVGVLDTGVDARHPDLKEKILSYKNFSSEKNENPADDYDHGTHVAGTIAGGKASGQQIGVAPGAGLVVARIFNRGGGSTKEKILEAMHWVLDPDGDPETDDGAQIINASWSTRDSFADRVPEDEIYCDVVQAWRQLDVIPVFAAGNNGPAEASLGLPAGCPGTLSVGASEHSDRLMYFSAVGPAQWKEFSLQKPELVAPGFKIRSARSGGGYREQLGTSMSAPHVTGVLALMKQACPLKTSEELMETITETAQDLGAEGFDVDFGWGRVDALSAVEACSDSKKTPDH